MSFPIVIDAPFITTSQMIEVDRLMIEDYGISLIQMMENAGRGLAILARERFLKNAPLGKTVLVMAGPGGNGGGAMVAARRLAGWGVDVRLILSHSLERMTCVPTRQLAILQEMNVPLLNYEEARAGQFDLILDGLLGYSLRGAPRGLSAQLIEFANINTAPILALDVPSGLDANSGEALSPTIKACATLTLAMPKTGLCGKSVAKFIGDLYCADISVPSALYRKNSLKIAVPNIFATSDIVRLAE